MTKKKKKELPYKYDAKDVLTLKGGAAQTTTHPGNLFYYQLCEDKFAEYSALSDKEEKWQVAHTIVEKVHQNGGIFRTRLGGPMELRDAVEKTENRFRQIAKPKVVASSKASPEDVVFQVGGSNHLYPGNAKWRALVDEYVQEYWPELFIVDEDDRNDYDPNGTKTQKPQQQLYYIPEFRQSICLEIADIIEARGGKFRSSPGLRVMSRSLVIQKSHQRFKDIKKILLKMDVQSRRHYPQSNVDSYELQRTGCTSSHRTIAHGTKEHLQIVSENRLKREFKENNIDSESYDEESDDAEDDDEDSNEEETDDFEIKVEDDKQIRLKKKEQAQARRERLKRRAELAIQDPQPMVKKPRKKYGPRRKHGTTKTVVLPPKPDPDMSEYERLRYEKMKRNYQRLKELGLLSGYSG